MNANELRIGNYIQHNSSVIFNVIGVHEFGLDIRNEIETTYIEYEELEPIPLTEEWLLKFGFKKDNPNYSWYRLDSVIINVFNGRAYKLNINSSNPYRHFYYVHQLQNLYFALTGEELKLKQDEN